MTISRLTLALFVTLAAAFGTEPALAQIDLPRGAVTAGRDTATIQPLVAEAPLVLKANLQSRMLVAQRADSALRTLARAGGDDGHPTPTRSFNIRKVVW